jgi:hypothetical protein
MAWIPNSVSSQGVVTLQTMRSPGSPEICDATPGRSCLRGHRRCWRRTDRRNRHHRPLLVGRAGGDGREYQSKLVDMGSHQPASAFLCECAACLAGRGGFKGSARYEGARWSSLASGALALDGALAAVDCTVEDTIIRHSHALILGSVRYVVSGAPGPALIYHHGAYGSSRVPASIVRFE